MEKLTSMRQVSRCLTPKHVHEVISSSGPYPCDDSLIPADREGNPAARGNCSWVDRCDCGATRSRNENGYHSEVGRWETSQ